MDEPLHGDPRRPDGDKVRPVKPWDARTDEAADEFGPKVGWGHDAVYRPPKPDSASLDDSTLDRGSPSHMGGDA